MRKQLAVAGIALFPFIVTSAHAQVVIDWRVVGDPGNPPDPTTGFGSVPYEYRIGTYEVTNTQYAMFLNAVAASDPNALYSTSMETQLRGGIIRSGTDGSYTYAVKPNMGNKPVNFVSWYDAARMCNWITNGQGSGDTESGVYTLTSQNSISAITRDLSNPDQVFIPTEDEWYKAAYYQPAAQGGDSDDYWLYATQSNTGPTIATATATGDVANPAQDVANYLAGADWNGVNGNVTTVGSAQSVTFYGALDMNGNVVEWNETAFGTFSRGIRGGSIGSNQLSLAATARFSVNANNNFANNVGFRLAAGAPPQPLILTGSDAGIIADGDIIDYVTLADSASLNVTGGTIRDGLDIGGQRFSVRNTQMGSDATIDISGGILEGTLQITEGDRTTISGGTFEDALGVSSSTCTISGGLYRGGVTISSDAFSIAGGFYEGGVVFRGDAEGVISGFNLIEPERINAQQQSVVRMTGGLSASLSVSDDAEFTYAGGAINGFVNLTGATSTLIIEGVAFYQSGELIDFDGATELRFDTADDFFAFVPADTMGGSDQFIAETIEVTFGPGKDAGSVRAISSTTWGGEIVLRLVEPSGSFDVNVDGIVDFFDLSDLLNALP